MSEFFQFRIPLYYRVMIRHNTVRLIVCQIVSSSLDFVLCLEIEWTSQTLYCNTCNEVLDKFIHVLSSLRAFDILYFILHKAQALIHQWNAGYMTIMMVPVWAPTFATCLMEVKMEINEC